MRQYPDMAKLMDFPPRLDNEKEHGKLVEEFDM